MKWLAKLLSQTDPNTDAKLLGYIIGVVASVAWLSYQIYKGLDTSWITCYGLFLGYTALGNITATIETIKRGDGGAK